jgi:CII-binding regulator of phage lambda lysogenization HflD
MGRTLMEVFEEEATAGNPANLILKAAQKLSEDAHALREQVTSYALEIADLNAKIDDRDERIDYLNNRLAYVARERDRFRDECQRLTDQLGASE